MDDVLDTRPAVSLRGIRKSFGPLQALDDVDLELARGEAHALLGENGAGKTTLMNVLAGFIAPDSGETVVDGRVVAFGSPRAALKCGIGMVHQHFRLVDQLTVAENLALASGESPWRLPGAELETGASELSARFGLDVDPRARVGDLSVGEQQRVEILRTLSRGAQVLILDEPTSVLTPQESESLCETLRGVAAEGRTVVFISHKLNEVLAVADRVTVMRGGRQVATRPRQDWDRAGLAEAMVGAAANDVSRPSPAARAPRDTVLEVDGLEVTSDRRLSAIRGLSLTLRRGEILGIAGVAGNGQTELAEAVTGLRRPDSGTIEVAGKQLAGRGPRAFLEAGVAYIPEDRRGVGLVPSEPIWRNAILRRYRQSPIGRGPFLARRRARRMAAQMVTDVQLSTDDIDTPVQQLSGGNAQRLLVGRELDVGRNVLVAVNPMQGLDLNAVAAVWDALLRARESAGVLLVSSDLDEILRFSDRIAVLYEGRIAGEFSAAEAGREQVGLLMGGGETAPD
jgi:general nucleoside transport system ATP-binding protein